MKTSSAFSFAQADIDHVLRLGGNTDRLRERVVAAFEKQKSTGEIADDLKTLYHGGNGLMTETGSIAAWYGGDGIHLTHGKSARHDKSAQVISWEDAAGRIGQLLEDGQFASNVELAEAESYERSLLAEKLWYLYHDFSDEAKESGYLSSLAENPELGFPEETAWLAGELKNPAFRQTLSEEYAAFWTAYRQDRGLMRFHYHDFKEIWDSLQDLSLPRKTFASEMMEVPAAKPFITEDEIDAALTAGSGMSGGKGRIYGFFQEHREEKERIRFLRDEYGTGGRSHALSGAAGSWEDHDGKGLRYRKDGCLDVFFTWEKLSRRIANLIRRDRYLTEQEQAAYDKIREEKALAEVDAIQSQQPEAAPLEVEAPQPAQTPTIREQFEQYKPMVAAAVTEDTAYRNACGHSDRENAEIEGNAAIRRAVLASSDLELIRLYSDVPEFRQRLHREVIEETYPKLHELLRPLSQDDIDDAIRAWNGNAGSKRAVVQYMADHAREKDTAAWLSQEYGGEHRNALAIRPGSPEGLELPWPKVQRRLAQLIQEENFLTEQERLSEPPKQEPHSYQVVVYHRTENGFDERSDYPTLEEAEKAAQGYVDGTMEPDGFAYDGAAVYDRNEQKYLRIIGEYPDEAAQKDVEPAVEAAEPVAPATQETPAFHSETVAVYPGDQNHLPYDVVVQTLRTEEPEPPVPVTEPEKTFEEILDEHPISVQVNGEWHTFPNAAAAEEAAYQGVPGRPAPQCPKLPHYRRPPGRGRPQSQVPGQCGGDPAVKAAGGNYRAGHARTAGSPLPVCGLGRRSGRL